MLVTGIKVRPARTRPPEANRPPDAYATFRPAKRATDATEIFSHA